jgi:hypothetical protein
MHGGTTVHGLDLTGVLRRHATATAASAAPLPATGSRGPRTAGEADLEWSWPPYAPVETDDEPFDTVDWAPSSVVWHPAVRLGRWIVVYRRCA